MTIGKKIIVGYTLVLALLVVVAAIAFYSLKAIERAYTGFLDVDTQAILRATELRQEARDQVAQYRGILLYPERYSVLLGDLRESHRQFDVLLDEVRALSRTEEGSRLINEITETQKKYREGQEEGILLIEEGKRDESIAQGEKLLSLVTALRDKCDQYIALKQRRLAEGQSGVSRDLQRIFLLLTSFSTLAVAAGIMFAVFLTRSITRQLRETIAQLSSSAAEILATTTQVAASATETASAVSETTATVEEVKQTAQVANQKAKYVSESAQKVAKVSQVGRKSVESTIQGMHVIQEQMESIAGSIVRLSEQSQAIGEIVATVNDLSDQSNLLAVNAAIEAAKAGEQGKGFAVVAQEVKSLAEQSRQATAQVRTILGDIQKATSAAVLATEQGNKAVEAGMKQSAETGESIRLLTESIMEAAQAATQIAASSQQQMVGMDQVALAMENIKQASVQNVAGARQAETAAHNLNDLGQKLNLMIASKAA